MEICERSKNMKKVSKVATYSTTQILTQCSVQGSTLLALVVSLVCSAIVVGYWHRRMYTCMNNLLSPFIKAQEMDFPKFLAENLKIDSLERKFQRLQI